MVAAIRDVFPSSESSGSVDAASCIGDILLFDGAGRRVSGLFEKLHKDLEVLAGLKEGWDSYGGRAISKDALAVANATIRDLISVGAPIPSLVPTSSGGVQAEWHEGTKSLEIEFVSPTHIDFYFEDEAQGIVEELVLNLDLGAIYTRVAEFE